MAYTCSYIKDDRNYRDEACFADIRNGKDATVIIEDDKLSLPLEQIMEFLEDLQKTFEFEIEYHSNFKEIHLHFDRNLTGYHRLICLTIVRFIWEGYYKPDGSYNGGVLDEFYKILPIYFNFKKYYKAQCPFKLLLIAVNWYVLQHNHRYSDNHFLNCKTKYCKIYDSNRFKNYVKDKGITGVNITFNSDRHPSGRLKDFKLERRSDYHEFYKQITILLWNETKT